MPTPTAVSSRAGQQSPSITRSNLPQLGRAKKGRLSRRPPVHDERTPRLSYRGAMSTTHTFFPNLVAEAPSRPA
jgi:hypothetical protein